MRRHAVLLTLISVASLLAGCASDEAPEEQIQSKEDVILTQNLGAIVGVVVDDRFRPLQVQEKAGAGEYQFEGFLLLQETGERLQSNENGEFFAVDLEPGTYTIRAQIEGHEATPQRVSVTAGEFAELNLVARRKASDNSAVLTDEFSGFLPCTIHFVALSYNIGCIPDSSGDTTRFGVSPDYSKFTDLSVLVIELNMNQAAKDGSAIDLVARLDLDHDYSSSVLFDGTWQKVHMIPGEVSPDPVPKGGEHHEWPNDGPFDALFFLRGTGAEPIRSTYEPVCGPAQALPSPGNACMRRGVGVQAGIRGQFMLSAFLGEPDVDITNYCVICP